MKINVIRQDSLKIRKAQRIRQINRLVLVGSITLFGLSVLWTSGQFVYLGYRNNQLTNNLKSLTALYTSRNKDEMNYLAVKQIVDTVDQTQNSRFGYKDFLNGIYTLLPVNAKVSGVDFNKNGVITVLVRLVGLNDYDTLIKNVNNGINDKNFLFSAIAQTTLQRDKAGQYLVGLELKIK